MPDAVTADTSTQVSHHEGDRILTGLGEPSEALQEHMDRRATPADTPAKESGTGAAAGGDVPAAAPEPSAEPPHLSKGRQRYSDLTRERDTIAAKEKASTERATALEREVADLRARVQQAATPQQAAAAQTQLDRAENRQADQAKPQGFQFPKFEEAQEQYPNLTYDDWQDAKLVAFADWRDAQRDIPGLVQRTLAAERQTQSFQQTRDQTHAKARTIYKDFDAVWSGGPGAGIIQHPMQVSAIVNHPQSEHIQYAILKDRDLALRLAAMQPIEFGMEIARLAPPPQAASSSVQHPAPPAPYNPVGTGSQTTVTPSSELTKRGYDYDKSEYRTRRAAERGVKPKYR